MAKLPIQTSMSMKKANFMDKHPDLNVREKGQFHG